MKGRLLVLLFCNFFVLNAFSQEKKEIFESLTIKDGLSQNNVLSILQDRKGYMWFGTYNGLNRYDGYSFRIFEYDPHDTTSLSQHLILCLFEDHEGMIWIGTAGMGLCKFDPGTEKFTRYTVDSANPDRLHNPTVTAINEDHEGMLWIGTVAGITRFNKKKGIFKRYLHDPADSLSISSNGPVNAIYKDHSETLWLGTGGNTINRIRYTEDKEKKATFVDFVRYQLGGRSEFNRNNHAVAFCEDKDGVLWIGTLGGLSAFNRNTGACQLYRHDPADPNSLSNDQINVRGLTVDNDGSLWIGTVNGLNKYDRASNKFRRFYHDPSDPGSIMSNDIHALTVDRSSTLWIGTVGGGISKLDPNKRWFTVFRHEPYNSNSLSEDAVRAIYEDNKGVIWIGTEGGGLNRLDRRTNTFTHYRHDPNNRNSLCSDFIGAITGDSKGNLWIGNGGSNFFSDATSGITIMDSTGVFRRLFNDRKDTPGIADVFTIYEDTENVLWIGTENGLRRYDPATKSSEHFAYEPQRKNGISDNWVYTILEDKGGSLWVGTGSKALNRFDPRKKSFTHYKYDPANPKSLSSNSVKSIYQNRAGQLWFGTSGGGLCLFHPETETFSAFTVHDGLPDNTIYNILEDDKENLWLSTNKGISSFSPTTKTFVNFDESDGLQSNQFASGYVNTGAAFKGKDGTLYFGGQYGLNMFHPDKLFFNGNVPPIVITQFRLFDKPDPLRQNASRIVLSYEENFFSFEFAALSYTNPGKNQYAYKLENFDNDWVFSGNRRYVSYTNLDPGEYIFKVKGSNNDGLWNDEGVSVMLVILPPWWMTSWAYALYFLITVSVLAGLYHYLISRERLKGALKIQRMEAEKMYELDHMKSQFFANISHEFRTPLTLILGPVEKLLKQTENGQERTVYELIERNARRLLKLINQLLDLSRLEAGSMKLEYRKGDITEFLRVLVHSFTLYAESKGIAFRSDIPAFSRLVEYDPEKLEMVLTNLLSNAFKYTSPRGFVEVKAVVCSTTVDSVKELNLSVTDNGIGIPKEQQEKIFNRFYQIKDQRKIPSEGTGIGLAVTKQIVDLLGGKLSVDSDVGVGATFQVLLPLRLAEDDTVNAACDNEGLKFISADPEPQRESHKVPNRFSGKNSSPVVLVVEDNEDLRRYICDQLEPQYQLMEADEGNQGLQRAFDDIPDLVISDIMMPGMDGIELCGKLKADERTSHIPLILLTAKATEGHKLEGLEAGADDYITKPFSTAELQARVRNLIEQRKKLRKAFSHEIRLEPNAISITPVDQKFLRKAVDIVENHIANPQFSVEVFGREVGMSRAQLYRKLLALTDEPPSDFIKAIRIKRAASLLLQNFGNISEVAFATGFSDPSYFTRCFRETMGQSPTEYISSQLSRTEKP